MNRHSSYSAPRSERSSGSYGGQRGRGNKRNTYNKRSWKDNRTLFTLVCYVLPFVVINLIILFFAISTPRIEYNVSDTQDYRSVELSIKIHSLLPVKEMTATLESKPIQLVKEKGVYKATLEDNGTLEIYVKGWNGMEKRANEHVAALDEAPPTIDEENYVMDNGILTIIASDSQSGVNFDAAYATNENEETIKPSNVNKETGEITFPMDSSSLAVYIEDFAGNAFKASFTSSVEGIDTKNRSKDFSADSSGSGSSTAGSSSTKETSKAKETTKAAKETTKATKETTKAAKENTKAAKETTKAAKETTKAAKETTKTAKETTKAAKETSKAAETTKASESANPVESSAAPTAAAPSTPVPGPGADTSPTEAATQSSQPAAPSGDSNDITIVPIS